MKNYRLSIKLLRIEPPIWRRIVVPETVSLAKLHTIIQRVMGWGNYHIYLFVGKGAHFLYTYDLGDGWKHEIQVEEIREGPPELVRCLEGARSCPPEDCGGPHGYEELLETIFDPKHPEHQERRNWLGDGFDPEYFNVEVINRSLKRLKVAREAA